LLALSGGDLTTCGVTNAVLPLSPFNSSLRDTTTEIYRLRLTIP
jgi:hypothetical protein